MNNANASPLLRLWQESQALVQPRCLPSQSCGCEDSNSARHPTHDTQMPPVPQTLIVPVLMGALCRRDGFVTPTAQSCCPLHWAVIAPIAENT